jgi:hypothetical protein
MTKTVFKYIERFTLGWGIGAAIFYLEETLKLIDMEPALPKELRENIVKIISDLYIAMDNYKKWESELTYD